MYLRSTCMQCFKEQGEPSPDPVYVEYVKGGFLIGKCSRGHEGPLAVQELDFEILFDMGGMAYLDGYSREAVTSFAAALERAYEFYIRVVFAKSEVAESDFNKVWKTLSRMSERQIGAFVILYLLQESGIPPILAPKWVEFRNTCIHKGDIPAKGKVFEYAEEVMRIIEEIVVLVKNSYPDKVQKIIFDRVKSFHIEGKSLTTISIATMISLSSPDGMGKPLEERLSELAISRRYTWLAAL